MITYLCLLSASPGKAGSSNISGSITADMGAGTELCRYETHIHNTVCTNLISSPTFGCIIKLICVCDRKDGGELGMRLMCNTAYHPKICVQSFYQTFHCLQYKQQKAGLGPENEVK